MLCLLLDKGLNEHVVHDCRLPTVCEVVVMGDSNRREKENGREVGLMFASRRSGQKKYWACDVIDG